MNTVFKRAGFLCLYEKQWKLKKNVSDNEKSVAMNFE